MLKHKVYALSLVALLCALLGAPTPSSARDPLADDTWQINPAINLARLFPDADLISLAVAVVPDPLVPRYRRLYDLDVVAIELGMLRNGYVLDRFYLPWNEKLRAAKDSQHSAGDDATALPVDRGAYGLMLFRCDSWRHVEDIDNSSADGYANDRHANASTSQCDFCTAGRFELRSVGCGPTSASSTRCKLSRRVAQTTSRCRGSIGKVFEPG
jgi:hypothetical protein